MEERENRQMRVKWQEEDVFMQWSRTIGQDKVAGQ